MPNAEADSYELHALEETVFGVTDAAAMDIVRNTGESLNFDIATEVSDEITSDGQVTDLTQVSADANGDFNFRLSYGTYDKFFQAALKGAFTSDLAIAGITISASSVDDSFSDSANGFGSIVVGQWVKVANFTTAANNGYFKVLTATAAKITVDSTLVTEAAGDSVTINGSMLRNGTTKKSFSLEKEFTDVVQFLSYVGMRVGGMSLEVETGSNLSGSFSFMGLDSDNDVATIGTGTPNAATTTPLMNAVNNVSELEEGGAALTDVFIQKLSCEVNNNLRAQDAVSNLGHIGIAYGKFNVTGGLTAYFANSDLYAKYKNNTESSLSYRLTDNDGATYILTFPRTKYSAGKIVAGSENSDVVVEMGFQAIKDTVTLCTMQIDKFAA